MATRTAGGGEKREREREMVRLVAGFALVQAAVALIMFLVLEQHNDEHFCQCMEACFLLSMVEVGSILFHHVAHVTMTLCSVAQMLVAALALASTGRLRWEASFVALCFTVATGMLSIRLVYTALFGTHCCFSGGGVQVAFAVADLFTQAAITFWGGVVSFQLRRAFCRDP